MQHQLIHVVYILTKLELGGAQKVCLSLLKQIPTSGTNILSTSLISGEEGILASSARKHEQVHLLSSFRRELSFFGLWAELRTFIAIVHILRRKKKQYATVIVHTHSTKAGLIGRWAALLAGIPYRIHTVHGFGFHAYQPWYIRKLIIAIEWCTSLITTQFVCVSEQDRNIGAALFPRFLKKSTLIRAAVPAMSFLRARSCRETKAGNIFRFGTIACFKPQKNIFDLLRACAWIKQHSQKQFLLEIIGDGVLRPSIEKAIVDYNLKEQVHLLGWQHDIMPFLHRWNVYVSSALWEGLPCAMVEARLARLPIITYDVGGVRELVLHKKNGYLVRPKDWRGLACLMHTVMDSKTLKNKLSCYPDNLGDFYESTMIQKHNDLYRLISCGTFRYR